MKSTPKHINEMLAEHAMRHEHPMVAVARDIERRKYARKHRPKSTAADRKDGTAPSKEGQGPTASGPFTAPSSVSRYRHVRRIAKGLIDSGLTKKEAALLTVDDSSLTVIERELCWQYIWSYALFKETPKCGWDGFDWRHI